MSARSLIRRHGIRCNLETPTDTRDAGGSVVPTWAIKTGGVRVFVQPASGSEAVRYGRESNRKFVMVYAEPELPAVPADRLTGLQLGTRILDIQSVRRPGELPNGHRMAHLVLEAEETD